MPGWLCSRSMLGVSWKTRSDPWDNSQQLVGVMQKPTVQTPISSILGDKLINPIGMGLYTHYKDYLLPVDDHHQYKVLIDSTYGWRAWARHISLKIGFFWRDFGGCYEKSIMSSGLLASKQIWNPRMVWIGRWFSFSNIWFCVFHISFSGVFFDVFLLPKTSHVLLPLLRRRAPNKTSTTNLGAHSVATCVTRGAIPRSPRPKKKNTGTPPWRVVHLWPLLWHCWYLVMYGEGYEHLGHFFFGRGCGTGLWRMWILTCKETTLPDKRTNMSPKKELYFCFQ